MRQSRDPLSPWAFFLPVALAVCLGQFAADWATDLRRPDHPPPSAVTALPDIRMASEPLPAPLPSDVAEPVVTAAAPQASRVEAPVPTSRANPDAADPALLPDTASAASSIEGDAAGSGRTLPGPATARQAGTGESCIHNTVAIRSANGWEQALENDAPVRCTASSP